MLSVIYSLQAKHIGISDFEQISMAGGNCYENRVANLRLAEW